MSGLILSTLIHSIFLSYPNFISLQPYCSFIQFFHALAAFYCHRGRRHFSKGAFVTDTALPRHLVSPDYSPCAGQIYISVRSSIALRKSSSSHPYFEPTCHYRASEPPYTYKCTGRCIEAFLHYFHNKW